MDNLRSAALHDSLMPPDRNRRSEIVRTNNSDGDIGAVLAQQHGEPGPALGDGQDVGRAPVGTGDVRVSAVAEEQAG